MSAKNLNDKLELKKGNFYKEQEEFRKKYKEMAAIRQIPELIDQLKKMK